MLKAILFVVLAFVFSGCWAAIFEAKDSQIHRYVHEGFRGVAHRRWGMQRHGDYQH